MNKNIKTLIRDTFIISSLTLTAGFVIGFVQIPKADTEDVLYVLNMSFLVLGFFAIGCVTKESRISHLSKVAFCVWLIGLNNVIFFNETIYQWVITIALFFITMFIGAGLSFLVVKPINAKT